MSGKRRGKIGCRLAAALAIGSVGLALSSARGAPPEGIRGTVSDSAGRPAAEAAVWLIDTEWLSPAEDGRTSRSRTKETARTDAQGRFALVTSPPADPYRGHVAVVARDPEGRLGWVTSYSEPTWHDLRVTLIEVGPAAGRVVDEAGQPLTGVRIEPESFGRSRFDSSHSMNFIMLPPELAADFAATTAADGTFALPGAPRGGSVSGRVGGGDHGPFHFTWNLDQPTDLRLDRAGGLSIRLERAAGDGPATSSVYVRRIAGAEGKTHYRLDGYSDQKTDAQGWLELRGLPPGDYSIDIGGDDLGYRWYAEDGIKAKVEPGRTTELAVPVKPGIAVAGKVVDAETKQGVAGARVRVANVVDHVIKPAAYVTTGADGAFSGFIRPGEAYVTVEQVPEQYSQPPESTRADTGERTELAIGEIALARSIPVRGIVRDEAGRPVPGASIYVTIAPPFGDRFDREPLTTDAEGRFTLKGLPPDEAFTLHAWTDEAVSDGGWVVVPKKQSGDVELRISPKHGFRIRGRVVDAQHRPLAGVPVRIRWNRDFVSRHSSMAGIGSPLPPVLTDAEGFFESRLLWPGDRYGAFLFVPGYLPTELPGGRSDEQWVGDPPHTLTVPDLVLLKGE